MTLRGSRVRGSVALAALLAASAWAVPRVTWAQTPSLEDRIDARTLELVAPILSAAERDSLPAEALRAKILEGVAKGRPPELVARVVAQLADDLRGTRSALRALLPEASLSGGELVAVAHARQQGVDLDRLADLWESRPDGGSLQVPITVLGELVRRGVPAAEASALMRHVVETGVPLERATQIPGRLDGASRPGVAPPEALQRALRDLGIPGPPEGRGPGAPTRPGGPRGPGGGGA